MIGVAIAAVSDASGRTDERVRFLTAIDEATAERCEEIITYADVALAGLDDVSVHFGGEAFLVECMRRAALRLQSFGVSCEVAITPFSTKLYQCWTGRCRNGKTCSCREVLS